MSKWRNLHYQKDADGAVLTQQWTNTLFKWSCHFEMTLLLCLTLLLTQKHKFPSSAIRPLLFEAHFKIICSSWDGIALKRNLQIPSIISYFLSISKSIIEWSWILNIKTKILDFFAFAFYIYCLCQLTQYDAILSSIVHTEALQLQNIFPSQIRSSTLLLSSGNSDTHTDIGTVPLMWVSELSKFHRATSTLGFNL